MAQLKDLIVSGNARVIGTLYADIDGNATTVNNHTVNKDVPSDALFTDTTYNDATTESSGLLSSTDKIKLNKLNIAYATCATAAATAQKEIVLNTNTSDWQLVPGALLVVKFTSTNTAQNPTLKVGDNDAKSVWFGTAKVTTWSLNRAGQANRPILYMYDGTNFVWISDSNDSNTTYSNVSLGQGYGTCTTAEDTVAKVVTLGSYSLTANGIVAVKFTYDVPANATMNINSKGAKAIYYRDSAITDGVIKAGDTAYFIYNTYYRLIGIDRFCEQDDTKEDKSNKVTSITSSSTDEQYPSAKAVYSSLPTLSNISGTLSVEKGGTGASSASSARTNLGLGTASTLASSTSVSGSSTDSQVPTAKGVYTYVTGYAYDKTTVDNKVSAIPKFDIEVVQALPTSNISPTTVYLLSSGSETQNLYTEYIYVDNKWEKLGTQTVDLSQYPTTSQMNTAISTAISNIETISTSEIDGLFT